MELVLGRGSHGHVGERAVLRRRVRTLRGRDERDRLPVARRAAGGGVVHRIARRPGVPLVDCAVRERGRRARGPARPRARTPRVRASVRLRGFPGEPGARHAAGHRPRQRRHGVLHARGLPRRARAHGARAGLHELPCHPAAHLDRRPGAVRRGHRRRRRHHVAARGGRRAAPLLRRVHAPSRLPAPDAPQTPLRRVLLEASRHARGELDRLARLEAEGRAYVFYANGQGVANTERDRARLQANFRRGRAQAQAELPAWERFLGR